MHTNDGAANFRILTASTIARGWREYIEEDPRKYLVGFELTMRYILLNYRRDGLPIIVVRDLETGLERRVYLPDDAHVAVGYSTHFEDCDLRVDYSSLSRPERTYRYHFDQQMLKVLKIKRIPSGLDSTLYVSRRVFARTGNVDVPITILYNKTQFRQDGSSPLYLYGYGAYGHAIPPTFQNMAIALANRGFVYAIAHVRGGDEMGHEWYTSATCLTKKRTFDDFIAAADALIDQKYTTKGQIVIAGRSAGGMLIGNVINRQPELFKAAIAHVPFVDVLNTMLDTNLPLTLGEFKEWGNPVEKRYFDYIRSYSPYENVKRQAYPHLMVTASITDPRVGYWEAAKWVAKLRRFKTDNNLLIFKTNMNAGHAGATSRADYVAEDAEEIVFILHVFGKV
jgi:oligopeptidase B